MDPAHSAQTHPSGFSQRFELALSVVLEAHAGQTRKGSALPYVAHPLHVCWILRAYSSDEDLWIAALLHDVVEDTEWTGEQVAEHFGARVAAVVVELSEDKRHPWATRKARAIEAVATLSEGALLVKACDKLHNLSTLAQDLAHTGDPEALWACFHGGREGTLSVARRMAEALAGRAPAPLGQALLDVVERLEALAASFGQDYSR